MHVDQWWHMYDQSLKGILHDAAFQHPAKYSWALIQHIYAHAYAQGWMQKGSCVLDPLAGVGIGGIAAANAWLCWLGNELEPHFVALAEANFAKHRRTWEAMGLPQPCIMQGDAREIGRLVASAGMVVSSPPYADSSVAHVDGNVSGRPGGTLRNRDHPVSQARHAVGYSKPQCIVSSPPFLNATEGAGLNRPGHRPATMRGVLKDGSLSCGTTPGQLGAMKEGSLAAVVSSPPFVDARQDTTPSRKGRTAPTRHDPEAWSPQCVVTSPPYADSWHRADTTDISEQRMRNAGYSEEYITRAFRASKAHGGNLNAQAYGSTPGQLGAMKEGSLCQAIITSPPYEGTFNAKKQGARQLEREQHLGRPIAYSTLQDNLGNVDQSTYWSSMASIYQQCFDLLPVNGVMMLIVKGFIRKGIYQDLPAQTAQLLTHIGFRVVHEHHAMLTSPVGQGRLFDDGEDRTSRKSFFRRLCERNGAPAIDYEVVLCAVKP
jgi:hypothetical protein